MEEKYININDWRIRYTTAGDSGPAIILLHGLGASLESWHLNVDPLGEQYRVFAPDIVYFGKSTKPDRPPEHLDFVDFCIGFMDALGLDRAILVGNSMGGAIASKATMLYPDRINGLVLVNSAGYGRDLAWWLRLRSLVDIRPRSSAPPPPWLTRIALRNIFEKPERLSDEMIDLLVSVETDDEGVRASRRVLNIGVDWRGVTPYMLREIRDCADQICVPTLIIWGKQDRVVPYKQAFAARRKIPNARVHLFDRCGHTPQLEIPAQFNALISEFAAEVTAPE